ncbi:MAG TPA: hypothetical protein VGL53_21595 [Bryobacteraceae bacterium]
MPYLSSFALLTALSDELSQGHTAKSDWPKLGPSLLIATRLIVAIRTAKWPARRDDHTSDRELDVEIEHAAKVAGRVLARLLRMHEARFPQRKEPWFKPDGSDQPH